MRFDWPDSTGPDVADFLLGEAGSFFFAIVFFKDRVLVEEARCEAAEFDERWRRDPGSSEEADIEGEPARWREESEGADRRLEMAGGGAESGGEGALGDAPAEVLRGATSALVTRVAAVPRKRHCSSDSSSSSTSPSS